MKNKIFKNKQLIKVVSGGIGALGANEIIGVIVSKQKDLRKLNLSTRDRRYGGENYTACYSDDNPLIKTYNKKYRRFEYWGLCNGYEIQDYESNPKLQCPEFPYFGAWYPDARCIDGYLWDLDKYEDRMLYGGGEDPCPFCNKKEYVSRLVDSGYPMHIVQKHLRFLNKKYN